MAITAYTLQHNARFSPQYQAPTLAELQPAVDADPETYEGRYFVALDQPVGEQIFYVESGVVIPAFEQDGYKATVAGNDVFVFNADGSAQTGRIGVQHFSGATNGDGQLTVHATADGTAGGAALFASIKSVAIEPQGIAANVQDRVFPAGYTITGGKTILCQVLRGASVLLGGASTRVAAAGVTVLVRVEGVLV